MGEAELLDVRFSEVRAKLLSVGVELGGQRVDSKTISITLEEHPNNLLLYFVKFTVQATDKDAKPIWQGGGIVCFVFRVEHGTKITPEASKVFARQVIPLLPEQIERFKTIAMILLASDGADITLLT